MDPALLSLLESLTGPQKIAYGDPFWNELLASPVLLDAVASDAASDNPLMLHFGQRLVSSNLRSGNLAHLLQHTIQCLRLSLAQRDGPADGPPDFFVLEALNCMCLTSALIGQLFALLGSDPESVMEHLQPFSYDSQDASRAMAQTPATEGLAVETSQLGGAEGGRAGRALHVSARPLWADGPQALVPALTEAVCSWVLAEGLELEHKLEAVNLLLVLLSSQLYHHRPGSTATSPHEPGSGGGGLGGSFNPFLEALMREAADQNERAAAEHLGDTSKALGFRMVRTLLMWFATQPRVLRRRPSMDGGSGSSSSSAHMSLSSLTPRWLGGGARPDLRTPPSTNGPSHSPSPSLGSSSQGSSTITSAGGVLVASSPSSGLLGVITLPFRTIYSLLFSSASATPTVSSLSAAHSLASASLPSPPRSSSHRSSPARQRSGSFSSTTTQLAAAAFQGAGGKAPPPSSVLADRAALLLLLLVQNQRCRGEVNAFRDAFCSIIDERYDDYVDDSEMLGQYGGHSLKMPFDKLYASFANNLHTEQGALLFYSLIIGNPIFLDTTLARGDVELLFLPLLQQMYHIDNIRSDRQLYVLVIVLLILTQDAPFNMGIFRRIILPSVPWYKERHLTQISLGSLVILCVLRVLVYTLNKARDLYLLSNCSAILLNLAAQAEGLHEYTAVRMTNVLQILMRRFLAQQKQQHAAAPSSSSSLLPGPPSETTTRGVVRTPSRHKHMSSFPTSTPPRAAAAATASTIQASIRPPPPPPATAPPATTTGGSSSDYSSYASGSSSIMSSTGVIDTVLENSNSRSPMRSSSHGSSYSFGEGALTPPHGGHQQQQQGGSNNQLELLSEAMRVLLTVFNVCLRPSLMQHNLRLIHYLLYSKRELEPYLQNPRIVELGWLGNLPSILDHFNRLVDEEEQTLSVEKAMDILERGARSLVSKMMRGGAEGGAAEADVKFTYEEADDPEEFFVPYIWEVVLTQTQDDLFWIPDKVTICKVGGAGAASGGAAADRVEHREVGSPGPTEAAVKVQGRTEAGAGDKAPQVVLTMHV